MTKSDIKACLFDLDGVIVHTAQLHFKAWRKLANTLGIDFDHEQNEQLKGVGRMESLRKILTWGNLEKSTEEINQLATQKNSWYVDYLDDLNQDDILPGVIPFIDELIQENIKIGLGSASRNAMLILEKIDLLDRFDVIIDGTKTTKGKPDPQVFLMGAEAVQVAPQQCVVFEDAQAGIEAANIGQFYSIGVGGSESLSQADFNIFDFENFSLNDMLTGLNKINNLEASPRGIN